MGFGLSGVLVLAMVARAVGAEKQAGAKPVLEIMSLDQGNCSLGLSWPWGALNADHVLFNDHHGPFMVVVESSGKGVRVTFDGWGKEPFVASATRIRIIYGVAGRNEIDFEAEASAGGAVRIRPADRPATEGRTIAVRLGERSTKGVANVSIEARSD
jgi:hypothetical protein